MKNTYKKINKNVTAEEFIKLVSKKGVIINLKKVEKLPNGSFLVMIRNLFRKTETYYFLQKYFIREFNMDYSCALSTRKGKEIMISNLRLSPIKLNKEYK